MSYNIKQLHHLSKTMRIFAWSPYLQKLVSVGAICRFIFNFFAIQNFSRHRRAKLLRKWIALVLQVKLRFMGCLVKANALVLGNMTLSLSSQQYQFLRNSYLHRDIQQIFFRQYFCELLENSSSASRYVPKSFRKFTKIHPWRSLKVAGFYSRNHRMRSKKKVFLERCFQN